MCILNFFLYALQIYALVSHLYTLQKYETKYIVLKIKVKNETAKEKNKKNKRNICYT